MSNLTTDDIIGLIILALFVMGIIYYALKRQKSKKTEDFEKRDN